MIYVTASLLASFPVRAETITEERSLETVEAR
jgi:hypothetical protein